jgi:hypothetical protein
MTMANELLWIEERRGEIAKEIARLQEELNEMEIALRVINRVPTDSHKPRKIETQEAPADGVPKLGPLRPSGCPSNYEMMELILASAEKEGKDGLTASEIISEMRKRYWPGLKDAQVSAPIYAFVRKGRFRRLEKGRISRWTKNEEGSTAGGPQNLL